MPCCAEAALPTDGAACRTVLGETFATGEYDVDDAAADECSAHFDELSGTELCGDSISLPVACANVLTPNGDSACEFFDECLEGTCVNAACAEGDIGLTFLCGESEP